MTPDDIKGMEHCDKYVNHTRFRTKGFGKDFNFKRGTIFRCDDCGILYHDNEDGSSDMICFFDSENCLTNFVPLFDDNWEERGRLHKLIWSKFTDKGTSEKVRTACFEILSKDFVAPRYKKKELDEYGKDISVGWEWNRHKLNYASAYDLNHMWNAIKNIK